MESHRFRDLLWALFIVVVITVALCIKLDPSILSFRSPGSFEYIRRGERYLQNGRYPDAIREYEKACRSSPTSDLIRAHAVWLYTDYGRVLGASGKDAEAVYYLSKAFDLKKCEQTIQNLALAYARRGLADVARRDLKKAVPFFARAREVAAASDRVPERLAICLYNAAVDAYKSGDVDIALLLLNESLLVGESARALELTGDAYRRKGALDEVAFYWKRALSIDGQNASLLQKIEQLGKEIALERGTRTEDVGHFELHYDGQLPLDRELVARALEKAYDGVGSALKSFPGGTTAVYLYSEQDFRDIFKLSSEVRAFYDGAIRIPLPAKEVPGEELSRYIAHEYAHAAVSALLKGACPVWLNEGLAVAAQYGQDGDDAEVWTLLGSFPGLRSTTIDSIDAAFAAADVAVPADRARLGLYYALSYSVVHYVKNVFGEHALRGILKRMKDGQHFSNALDDQLLMSEKDFEERWRRYVEEKTAAYNAKGEGHE